MLTSVRRIFSRCSRSSSRHRPTVVASPAAETMMPASPRLAPGSRATSAITSVLTSAENAAAARICCSAWALAPVSFSGETEMATKSSPMSAPATVAQPPK